MKQNNLLIILGIIIIIGIGIEFIFINSKTPVSKPVYIDRPVDKPVDKPVTTPVTTPVHKPIYIPPYHRRRYIPRHRIHPNRRKHFRSHGPTMALRGQRMHPHGHRSAHLGLHGHRIHPNRRKHL